MIIGAHVMVQSKDAKADKAFFAKVLKLPYVDAGRWPPDFRLAPTEVTDHGARGKRETALLSHVR